MRWLVAIQIMSVGVSILATEQEFDSLLAAKMCSNVQWRQTA